MNKEGYRKMIFDLENIRYYCGDFSCNKCPIRKECDNLEDSKRNMVKILTGRLRQLKSYKNEEIK